MRDYTRNIFFFVFVKRVVNPRKRLEQKSRFKKKKNKEK